MNHQTIANIRLPTHFTPGPWQNLNAVILTVEDDPQVIAYTSEHRNRQRRPTSETEGNAELLALTPFLPELIGLLDLAYGYLNHPEVKHIPFALPSASVTSRITTLLEKIAASQEIK